MNKLFCDNKGNIINYYEILHLPYMAEKKLVRSAFCNLIKMFHPDISGKNTTDYREIVNLIINGYKVLTDDKLSTDYNKLLINRNKFNNEGYICLQNDRIKYSISLKDLVTTRLLNQKIKRKERIRTFGQDIEIFLTAHESERGALAFVELPSRMTCVTCFGEDQYCHVCNGVGRISTVSKLEVKIHPFIRNGETINVDLMKIRPDRFTTFTIKNLKIKISIIEKKKIENISKSF